MKGKNLDMTTGSIWRNMVAFAMPVFLGQLFQQLYNTADSIIVGNFSGKGPLAAVSSSGNLIFMFMGFFMGLSLGAGVVISRYFGAKDYENPWRPPFTPTSPSARSAACSCPFWAFFSRRKC